MKKVYFLSASFILLLITVINFNFAAAQVQQVLNPNDPIVNYNPNNPPATPPWGAIAKWVVTPTLHWNTSSFKAYYFDGMAFRLKYPKSYDPNNNTKKYPILVFLHGEGEKGTIYNNELQLYHCAQAIASAADKGNFDAFVLFPQTQNGFWSDNNFGPVSTFINLMAQSGMVDLNAVYLSGLSSGGQGDWKFIQSYPDLFAAAEIISAAYVSLQDDINSTYKYIPIWLSQGGLDNNPTPYTAHLILDDLNNVGAPITYKEYPTRGHNVWDVHYQEPDAIPYYLRQNKTNPVVFFGRSLFCPNDTDNIDVTLGLMPGFDGYQWRKNGVVIQGATSNTLHVTSMGTYDASIKRGSSWSYWSPTPIVIGVKPPTQTPGIQVSGLMSNVLPAPDGKTTVDLTLPAGYSSYIWKKMGDNTVLGTQQVFTAPGSGDYIADVTEADGCSSNYSAPFHVASASGPNPPDAATNLNAFATSQTSITLNWSQNPSPEHNETGFEIYRSTTAGGPYQLVFINHADSTSYDDENLESDAHYYYIVRAIDSTAAAIPSAEVGTVTQVDDQPPTAPGNLTVTATDSTSISLSWDASTDNTGVSHYFLYINGVKSYVTTGTSFTANNLTHGQLYNFVVKADDAKGNVSGSSNQVTAPAIIKGLTEKFYTTDPINNLPDFNALTPVVTLNTNNISLPPTSQVSKYYAIMWTGLIRIPVSGTYTFGTSSDDGSKLYINTVYSFNAPALVNNDFLQGDTYRSGTINLAAGVYPIVITYFQKTGGAAMRAYWQSTALGLSSKSLIPDSAFTEAFTNPGNPPAYPSGLKATPLTYNTIRLNWTDASSNETGFEIYRANNSGGPYNIITTTAANINSYSDSTLSPSTTYYYKIQAINNFGASGFNPSDASGLSYSYYDVSGLTKLPDFSTLTPVKTGSVTNFNLDMRDQEDNFALKFSGNIKIPVTGNYTFYLKSDDGSKLYLGGSSESNVIVNYDGLHGAGEKSATINNLQAGNYPIYVTYFEATGGQSLVVSLKGPGLSKRPIPDSFFVNVNSVATTPGGPAVPLTPINLSATATGTGTINVNWMDKPSFVKQFVVYRSVGDSTHFQFLTNVPCPPQVSFSFTDSSLFANTVYYYKVAAQNILGQNSNFSILDSSLTGNNPPVLESIGNQTMRFDTTLALDLASSDPDGDQITLMAVNLPNFASFTDYGDGTGLINFTPSSTGTYPNITVSATDQHGGISSETFTLVVNDNYAPVLAIPETLFTDAGSSALDTLVATDGNPSDQLHWSIDGLPSFISIDSTSISGKAILSLNPTLNDAGSYSALVTITDSQGATDSKFITINVNKVDPGYSVYVNFNDGTHQASGIWNNTNKVPHSGDVFANLKDGSGNTTSIGLNIVSNWEGIGNGTNNLGVNTGNNSGIYPDSVLVSAYWTQAPAVQTLKVTGLDITGSHNYNLIFFGSRAAADNRTTTYTVNGTSVSLNAAGNRNNTVEVDNITPDPDGTITFTMQAGTGSSYGYLNALVINANYDDGNPPAAPQNLNASLLSGGIVGLSWSDEAYNETGYEVYRSTDQNGTYTLLNPNAANPDAISFNDSSALGGDQYYYKVRSVNAHGTSAYAGPVGINTVANDPSIANIGNIAVNTDDIDTVVLSTIPNNVNDTISLSVTGLPGFASFQDAGNGTGNLILKPQITDVGTYSNIVVTATNKYNSSSSKTFAINILNSTYTFTYVNFNNGNNADLPWNNTNATPNANTVLSNLLDAQGNATGVSLTLQDAWTGSNTLGATTGNNTGIYPDIVMQNAYYDGSGNARHILLSGLDNSRKYNVVFFGSRTANDNRTATYTINGQSVSLNAAGNTSNTVQINGIQPQSGQIQISINRASGSSYAYLNAMVIQSYIDNGVPLDPSDAAATALSQSKISLAWNNNSTDVTGFQIWRSTTAQGDYDYLATVAGNVTSYQDQGLESNTRYFYKIRALNNSITSQFSNIASATTLLYAVYLNFNDENDVLASAPWNNTHKIPIEGDFYGPLLSDAGSSSGITIECGAGFSGVNHSGMNTGNNSGIYPDNVINRSFWVDGTDTASLLVTGLNLSMSYNFIFFGSRSGSGVDRTTIYSINGVSVGLQTLDNISQTVQIVGVRPDQNGNVLITIHAGPNSSFGYIGALVIQAHNNYDDNGQLILNDFRRSQQTFDLMNNKLDNSKDKIAAYPNPFHNNLQLVVPVSKDDGQLQVTVWDMNGQQVYSKSLGQLSEGRNIISLNLADKQLAKGAYIVRLVSSAKPAKTIIVIKQ